MMKVGRVGSRGDRAAAASHVLHDLARMVESKTGALRCGAVALIEYLPGIDMVLVEPAAIVGNDSVLCFCHLFAGEQ